MKKKKGLLFAILVIMAGLLSACSGYSGKNQAENETTEIPETSADAAVTETADISSDTVQGGTEDSSTEAQTEETSTEAPYGAKISSISDEGIEFYWKRPEYADGYEVYRSYEEDGTYEKIAEYDTRTTYTHLDTDFDTEQHSVWYKVRSYLENEDGTRTYSEFTEAKEAAYRESMELERTVTYMPSGTSRSIQAFYGWGNVQDAVWESDQPEVAEISEDGVITAMSQGTCTISCTSESLQESVTSQVVVDREALEPLEEITSRYTQLEETGIWENTEAEDTNDAVIMMVGDLMCTSKQIRAGTDEDGSYSFNDSFTYVSSIFAQSDYAIGNLETMLSSSWPYMSDETYIENKANCNAPSRYLDALRSAGFDAVVMANNHNCDAGEQGVLETLEQVEKYQLGHTGLYADEEDCRYLLVDINGIQVGFLSYMSSHTSYNGKDADWSEESVDTMLNYFSQEKAERDIAELRAAGAEYVIVYMHWGVKNNRNVNDSQREEAQLLADAGADYIVGSHPHLIQEYDEIETADGRIVPCFYSLGDFQSSILQVTGNRDSVILRIRLVRKEDGTVELAENSYIPCYNYTEYEGCSYPVLALNTDLNGGIETKKMKKARKRIAEAVGDKIEEYTVG